MILTHLIFFPEKAFFQTPEDYHLSYENAFLDTADGAKLHGWFLPAEKEKGVLLFLHGNAGNIGGRLFKAKGWIERGFSVFLIDYRSYGKSEGEIKHQDDIYRDAETAFNWLMKEKKYSLPQIILYGESIGTAPAVKLASEHKVWAVILEAPFTSFLDLVKVHYPFAPPVMLKDFIFSNIDRIADIKAPLFILHGTHDEICPFLGADLLMEKAPDPKELYVIQHGQHNDLPAHAGSDYWDRPLAFLEKHK